VAALDHTVVSTKCHSHSTHLRAVCAVYLADNHHFLTRISVATAFRRSFLINADSPNTTIRLAGYEHIPVDVHVPVLDIPVAVDLDHGPSRILSDAVIQGTFYTDRRDYLEIFAELKESLARS
jgi:hypothetical protein